MSPVRLLCTVRLSRLLLMITLLLLFIPFLTYHYVSQLAPNASSPNHDRSRSDFDQLTLTSDLAGQGQSMSEPSAWASHHVIYTLRDLHKAQEARDLHSRVLDLMRIRSSVISELRLLESKRNQLQSDLSALQKRLEDSRNQLTHRQSQLNHVQTQLEAAEYAQKEAALKNKPFVAIPLKPLPVTFYSLNLTRSGDDTFSATTAGSITADESSPVVRSNQWCSMASCFDYSRCSLIREFRFHVFFNHTNLTDAESLSNRPKWINKYNQVARLLTELPEFTDTPETACLFVIPLVDPQQITLLPTHSHWNGGRNHLLINLLHPEIDLFTMIHFPHMSIIAQSTFHRQSYRNQFDLIVAFDEDHDFSHLVYGSTWPQTNFSPAKRSILFVCIHQADQTWNSGLDYPDDDRDYHLTLNQSSASLLRNGDSRSPVLSNRSSLPLHIDRIRSVLERIQSQSVESDEKVYLDFNAPSFDKSNSYQLHQNRLQLMSDATFVLVLPPDHPDSLFNSRMAVQLIAILTVRSIPVVIGSEHVRLPLDEVIDWSLATVQLPSARVSELHLVLRAIPDATILSMKRAGQFLLQRYFFSLPRSFASVLAVVRQHRLQMPAPPAPSTIGRTMYSYNQTADVTVLDRYSAVAVNSNVGLIQQFEPIDTIEPIDAAEQSETLGPIEAPQSSLSFQHNWSDPLVAGYRMWNSMRASPFHTYPNSPFDDQLPSDAEFVGSTYGYRPIGDGWGGAGKQFSERLGGNAPTEQFTIVMLTYEREQLLVESLRKLRNLPYLNKIIVIWNAIHRLPTPDFRWPQTGVPLVIIQPNRNSLNNRFLPYDQINTEAILSIDDDAHLRHDEIVFGFR